MLYNIKEIPVEGSFTAVTPTSFSFETGAEELRINQLLDIVSIRLIGDIPIKKGSSFVFRFPYYLDGGHPFGDYLATSKDGSADSKIIKLNCGDLESSPVCEFDLKSGEFIIKNAFENEIEAGAEGLIQIQNFRLPSYGGFYNFGF